MFDRNQVWAAFEAKREHFQRHAAERAAARSAIEAQFARLRSRRCAELTAELAEIGIQWPGALPTPELDQAREFCLPFLQRWHDHRQAREWALTTLLHRPVIAVDGSQLPPTKDFSIPVAAVQIGWFINEHRPGSGGYVKQVDFEVLAPDELGEDADDGQGFPSWRINQIRFVRECEKLCELMDGHAHLPPSARPLCFFDGSFIVSFAGQLRPERAQPYLDAVRELLRCSRQSQVPLVGLVDSSYSRDLVALLAALNRTPPPAPISDAQLCGPILPHWGDRTPLFACARADALSEARREQSMERFFYLDVGFTYMRLTADRPPARVELPLWVLEAGLADQVLDLVRAECVVGNGYPYAVETADATAVISAQDRARFYAAFQLFAQQEALPLQIARKALSKQQRR